MTFDDAKQRVKKHPSSHLWNKDQRKTSRERKEYILKENSDTHVAGLNPAFFDNRIWMNSKEAADYLRISVNSLRIMVLRKQVIAHKFNGRLRFKKSELDERIRPIE